MSKTIYSTEYIKLLTKLKVAREKRGLTQGQVAKLLNKPQSYISKIEVGERRIDIIELSHLARIYKKPITTFIK